MSDWHGYPQHPDAHPERPWWRWDGLMWIRPDGRGAFTQDIAGIDADHPLPPPPPKCRQVWVWPTEDKEREVAAVFDGVARFIGWTWSATHECPIAVARPQPEWPPPGAALVAGPGAPWAPMGCS